MQPSFTIGGRWMVQPFRSIVGAEELRYMVALTGAAISKNRGRWRVQPYLSIGGVDVVRCGHF
jgi:hypothetical protein